MTLTVRLTEAEERELKRIMKHYNEKTASKAIKGMILQFMDAREVAKESTIKLLEIQNENTKIKELIAERQSTKNKLNQIQSNLTRIANK